MRLGFFHLCLTILAFFICNVTALPSVAPTMAAMNFAKQPPNAERAVKKRLADKHIHSSFVTVSNKAESQKKKLKTPIIVGLSAVGVGLIGAGAVYMIQSKKKKSKSSKSSGSSSGTATDGKSAKSSSSSSKVIEERDGWSKILNKDKYFYFHKATSKSQWDPPDCFPEDKAMLAAAANAVANLKMNGSVSASSERKSSKK